ncbi:MerR family redox-sensitive transcriptional activator SoxR [Mumia flava]|uniref:MerR family redox-sensitive transcriptional activator SoxR n=1 Tax=Mumia flava TaxID=1348852 RepID=A0A0B2B787_9ACTN|nr:redox-sensitive transcriptional activator SoxR [Mumia flava]PJJ57549.1 MerR family redox-sensitive transcriptional activator SoxR [Mumia flava]
MSAEPVLTIGEVAERSGVAASGLRYYESIGLISSIRTSGNQRRYVRSTLRRVAFIRTAAHVGLTLEEIREALATLPSGRTPTKRDWTRLSRSWRGRLEERISELVRLRDDLDSCIGCGCLSLQTCRLSNPGDRAARLGPGPRYLLGDRPSDT